MLGSFPPSRSRWCMDFFYPNFQNDMWRIFGLVFFADKDHFVDLAARRFRQSDIEAFLRARGIALYDTATAVVRTRNTASDKDLEIVQPTDLDALLSQLLQCAAVVATGQKSCDVLSAHFGVTAPPVGGSVPISWQGRTMQLLRMPSSSRAYPLKLQQKARYYEAIVPFTNTNQ